LKGENVLEVGPGPGGLTRACCAPGRVTAIEMDRAACPRWPNWQKRFPGS
jgi:16S rRNA (adenine1518-N6/adenine1519-N6)-dimethyltransferase